MKITVVGSGNAFNTNGRAHAAYLLENHCGNVMLLDCGATTLYRLQQMQFDFMRLDCVVLTHFHGDHIGGLPFLILQLHLVTQTPKTLHIYGPPGVKEICKDLIDICYPGYFEKCDLVFEELKVNQQFERLKHNPEFLVRAFPMTHRLESLGYQIKDVHSGVFAFSGDSAFDEKLLALMKGVDIGVLELSIFTQLEKKVAHVSLAELRAGEELLLAKRIILTHIYDELENEASRLGFETAYDGLQFEV